MNEKKLLLGGVLSATAVAAVIGVVVARDGARNTNASEIPPITVTDDSFHAVPNAEVPIRLTSSDGTGLKLTAMKAKAVVEDPLALTELHLTFENPEDRTLEGTFRIALPQGASLSRFAMKVGGIWQEGEVVEKQAARRAYEDFLHRRQDPALMEQGAGNEFSARIFPIPANGTKEIVIAYAESLEAGAPYVLPLRGLPTLGSLDVDVHAAGAKSAPAGGRSDATFSLHQTNVTPGRDFVVEGKQLPRSAGLRNDELVLARVVPFASSRPEPVASAVVLVDTSASRGLGLAEQAALLAEVIAKLPPKARLVVGAFDQEVVSIFDGEVSGFGKKETDALVARRALGASDFGQALGWAEEQAKRVGAKRVLFASDGVATAGELDAQKLKERVEKLRGAGVERMDAIAVGGIRDDAFLRTVVRGVLDRDGVVLDAKLGATALAARLGEATSSGIPVKVEGAEWSWPSTLDGLQAGDEVKVYAKMAAQKPVRITVGTQDFSPDLRSAPRPLLERAYAQARIQNLIDAPVDDAAVTKQQIVALSTRHRVLSPYTAMLVLETDRDYDRFGLDRNAKVDILSVEDGKVAVLHGSRSQEQKEREAAREKSKDEDGDDVRRSEGRSASSPRAASPAPAAPLDESFADGTGGAAASAVPPPPAAPAPVARPRTTGGPSDAPAMLEEPAEIGAPKGSTAGEPAPVVVAPQLEAPKTAATTSQPAKAAATASPPARVPSRTGAPGADGPPESPMATRPAAPNLARDLADPWAAPTPRARRPASAPGGYAAGGGGTTQPSATADYQVRSGSIEVDQGLGREEVQRVLRGLTPRLRACYVGAVATSANLRGHMQYRVVVGANGTVRGVRTVGAPLSDPLESCTQAVLRSASFAPPAASEAAFTANFDFVRIGGGEPSDPGSFARSSPNTNAPAALPYDGRFRSVMQKLRDGDKEDAFAEATVWHDEQPGDEMSLVALGEAAEARGETALAARAYGSILELFSFRADARRFAGERLERLKDRAAAKLAVDTYEKAVQQRPDHPASHRLYAFALVKQGRWEDAFEAMAKGARRSYPEGRFAGAARILREDLGLIAAGWTKAEPERRTEIAQKLQAAGGTFESGPSLRFVLVWETDANDVDFHIYDGKGGHAYYGTPQLPSGGSLYADVTTGYGPECFTIRGPRERRAYPYTLQAHYYARGPMGYGMGKLEVVEHDGKGGLTFDERPFVVMVDRAFVDLGIVEKNTDATALK